MMEASDAAPKPAGGQREQPVRAGIIGPHGIGSVHCAALRSIGVDVAAVASSSEERARAHAARLGVVKAYCDADALIAAPDLDAVHICTPNHLHAELSRKALAAGKHVVCEKPLATSVDDARDLERLAAASDLVTAVCYVYRYYTLPQLMRLWAGQGKLGRVHLIQGTYLLDEVLLIDNPDHWMLDPRRIGPSLSLADIGVHWWDLVEFVSGQRITDVTCLTQTARPQGHKRRDGDGSNGQDGDGSNGQDDQGDHYPDGDDSDAVLLRLDNGAIAVAAIAQTAPGHKETLTLELIGTAASAAWSQEDADRLRFSPLAQPPRTVTRTDAQGELMLPDVPQLPNGQTQDFADAFRNLMAAIYEHIRGTAPDGLPYPTFTAGARGVEVLAALLRSAAEHRWVRLAPD